VREAPAPPTALACLAMKITAIETSLLAVPTPQPAALEL
jgi:hypothetical protein